MPSDASRAFIARFADFIDASPSSYHAVAGISESLAASGFERLDERLAWRELPRRAFVVRDGGLIAWVLPERPGAATGVRIVGAHSDSPGFKLKPNPTVQRAGWQQLGMEVYGGPLLNSWLDRDLGLAGRVSTREGELRLVRTEAIMRIPQLAPHLDRSVNEQLHLDKQQHLMPVFAVGHPELSVEQIIAGAAGLDADDIAFADVLAYPTEKPAVIGVAGDFLAASRMDNLSSVFAGLDALLGAGAGSDIALLAVFDHEEVGSATRSGAAGPFLDACLRRLAASLQLDADALLARSVCVSADAGHAVHPNYVQMYDPQNLPLPNGGPLLKINANQRYATDAVGAAVWLRACAAAGVQSQTFVSNNAVSCGSTIGPLTASRIGITTVDVGIGLLSMHSARELCGVDDPLALRGVLAAFWAE